MGKAVEMWIQSTFFVSCKKLRLLCRVAGIDSGTQGQIEPTAPYLCLEMMLLEQKSQEIS